MQLYLGLFVQTDSCGQSDCDGGRRFSWHEKTYKRALVSP